MQSCISGPLVLRDTAETGTAGMVTRLRTRHELSGRPRAVAARGGRSTGPTRSRADAVFATAVLPWCGTYF